MICYSILKYYLNDHEDSTMVRMSSGESAFQVDNIRIEMQYYSDMAPFRTLFNSISGHSYAVTSSCFRETRASRQFQARSRSVGLHLHRPRSPSALYTCIKGCMFLSFYSGVSRLIRSKFTLTLIQCFNYQSQLYSSDRVRLRNPTSWPISLQNVDRGSVQEFS